MADTIILVGFMGAGKTTVGRQLAKTTSKKFLDLDDAFVEDAGMTINEFMEEKGEQAFRQRETAVLERSLKTSAIISTGGGIVESKENRQVIADSKTTVVFLQADFSTVLQRLSSDTYRPLLRQLSMKALLDRFEYRQPLYRSVSDSVIMTKGKAPDKIVQELTEMLSLKDNSLVSLRSEIDSLDRQILSLISRRLNVVKEVAHIKKHSGESVIQENRMQQIRLALKEEFKTDANLTDNLIDRVVDLLTTTSIAKEQKMIG